MLSIELISAQKKSMDGISISFTMTLRRMRWAGYVVRMKAKRIAYRILVVKPEGKSPLRKRRRRCVDNIKMDLREIRWDDMD
jgi:hypothetical protein